MGNIMPKGYLLVNYFRKIFIGKKKKELKLYLVIVFVFYFSKTYYWEYKENTIFLYFWNQKHVWLVEIKKTVFWRKK